MLHFHGTDDKLVPYDGGKSGAQELLNCKSVDETVRTFAKLDGCPDTPKVESLPKKADRRDIGRADHLFAGEKWCGWMVVLIKIDGGGHNWPDRPVLGQLLGKSTHQIDANEMIWDFFEAAPSAMIEPGCSFDAK